MSAYLCNPTHIGILAQRLSGETSQFGEAFNIAEVIARENLKSVAYRYNIDEEMAAQEFLSKSAEAYITACRHAAAPTSQAERVPALRIIGMVRCSEYQSCEHDEWDTSYAKRMLDFLFVTATLDHLRKTNQETGWEWTNA